ncbi:Endonuclease/exonuclease/phosphatase, partial [Mycena capillaripes]
MRGRFDRDGQDKCLHINQIMRDKRIGVLAVQETHLTDSECDNLSKLFENTLLIHSTVDAANPGSKGTAIVLNKRPINVNNVQQETLVEGRAMILTVQWRGELALSFLSVYAPNIPADNARFLESLTGKLKNHRRPDFALGDFNMVEDIIDRLPHHKDPQNVSEAMSTFKVALNLRDGWRQMYTDTLEYSFFQKASGSQSQIDRILVPFDSLIDLADWEMETCALPTDHKLGSVKYSSPKLPFIGRGRWCLPLHLLKDKETMKKIQELGKELEDATERCEFRRTAENNSQVLYKKFLDDVTHIVCHTCRDRAKKLMPAIDKEIDNLNTQLRETLNNPNEPEEQKTLVGEVLQ